jgi:hypothetical protein
MTRRLQRPAAFAAILATAWAALWPLVSASHAALAEERVELCHQAGSLVAPGEAPAKPGKPAERETHCPLCIMAFYGAPVLALQALPLTLSTLSVVLVASARGAYPHDFQLALPPSRAPPFAFDG